MTDEETIKRVRDDKPLTGYPADREALNQAYCVSIGKRNAAEVHDAFLKGVEWQRQRARSINKQRKVYEA